MEWEGQRESENVEDRRGETGGGLFGSSLGSGMPGGPMVLHGGLGTIAVILLVSVIFGVNPLQLLQQAPPGNPGGGGFPGVNQPAGAPGGDRANPEQERLVKFVKVVLADTEDVWSDQFRRMGRQYQKPTLVLFSGEVGSACGLSSAAVGPFYCPEDEKVYLDLSFFDEMERRFHAKGEFARTYVIAHEIGHHVQKLLGISDKVDALRRRASKTESNELSVRLELQADFLAGVFAHHAPQLKLTQSDIEDALRAANAIGDDALQKQAQGFVVPDSFTHGTSQQRMKWFTKGFQTGDINQGDTFGTDDL
jgi:uncharacterized protein